MNNDGWTTDAFRFDQLHFPFRKASINSAWVCIISLNMILNCTYHKVLNVATLGLCTTPQFHSPLVWLPLHVLSESNPTLERNHRLINGNFSGWLVLRLEVLVQGVKEPPHTPQSISRHLLKGSSLDTEIPEM